MARTLKQFRFLPSAEAGLRALRERRMRVNKADFTAAKEQVLYRKNENTVSPSVERFLQYCSVGLTLFSPRDCICKVGLSQSGIEYCQRRRIVNEMQPYYTLCIGS